MTKIIIAGIGTEVGKTVVAAIIATSLQGEYWKPVQCGEDKDSDRIKNWRILTHEPAYSLNAPFSPHHAARLENRIISTKSIAPPITTSPLIIESVGGIFVPLNEKILSLDLFKSWNCSWVVVSRHYIGSINHTLLTLNTLKQNNISVAGVIFNGEPNPDSENAILKFSNAQVIGRLLPEPVINLNTIQKYAKRWKNQL